MAEAPGAALATPSGPNMEPAWSRHDGAGMEPAWRRRAAGVEPAWGRREAGMEPAWSRREASLVVNYVVNTGMGPVEHCRPCD